MTETSPYVPKYLRNRPNLRLDDKCDEIVVSHGRRKLLSIDINAINAESRNTNEAKNYEWGDTTYRHDGFTIGKDYMRCDGKTVTRGKLMSELLTVGDLIGEGNFSQVHRGELKQNCVDMEIDNPSISTPKRIQHSVAIKKCTVLDISEERQKMMIKELRTLSKIYSESLVGFHGAFLEEDAVVLIMEYMDEGSLEQWRKTNSSASMSNCLDPSVRRQREAFFASIAFQALFGLEYLHSQRIIHRDVKPGNILLNRQGAVKLCDFGISSLFGEDDHSLQTTVVGTSRFMSPERLRAKPYGKSSDIWSFGLVLLELWKGAIPFQDCESIVSLVITVEETSISDLLSDIRTSSPNLHDILRGCLAQAPEKRMPAFILRQAPWFTVQHSITTLEAARALFLRNYISKHSSE